MRGYASHTGTRRNLAGLKAAGWGLVLSPFGDSYDVGLPYMIDNPAWPVSQLFERGKRESREPTPADLARFSRLVERRGAGADLVVVPDIVLGGARSLDISGRWLPILRTRLGRGVKLLIAVQDGFEHGQLGVSALDLIRQADGIFVGGSTRFKEDSLPVWAALKRELGCWLHVGRVNTARRIALCAAADANSFDGTSASQFAKSLPMLEQAARQPALIGFDRQEPEQ